MKIKLLCVAILLSFAFVGCNTEFDVEQGSNSEISTESVESTESMESEIESSVESSEVKEPADTNVLQFKNHLGEVVLDATHIESATANYYMNKSYETEPMVILVFTEEGSKLFAEATKIAAANGKPIGIYVDGVLISEPKVSAEYAETGITDGEAIISGDFADFESAEELSNAINRAIPPVRWWRNLFRGFLCD